MSFFGLILCLMQYQPELLCNFSNSSQVLGDLKTLDKDFENFICLSDKEAEDFTTPPRSDSPAEEPPARNSPGANRIAIGVEFERHSENTRQTWRENNGRLNLLPRNVGIDQPALPDPNQSVAGESAGGRIYRDRLPSAEIVASEQRAAAICARDLENMRGLPQGGLHDMPNLGDPNGPMGNFIQRLREAGASGDSNRRVRQALFDTLGGWTPSGHYWDSLGQNHTNAPNQSVGSVVDQPNNDTDVNGSVDNGSADNGTADNGTADNGTADNGTADNTNAASDPRPKGDRK